jgi:hypothetical protein
MGLRELLNIGYQTFYELMPSLIIWKDKELYWFDPNFEECIKNCVKSDKRFIMIKVSYLHRPDSLHANVIIYDKEDASYRRFEPYGNSSTYDDIAPNPEQTTLHFPDSVQIISQPNMPEQLVVFSNSAVFGYCNDD